MDLNKHIVSGDGFDHFHSHGFAKVQNGGRLGAVGKMTFAQRQEVEKNRRLISGYHRSTVASSYKELRDKISESRNLNIDITHRNSSAGIKNQPTIQPKKYNPYA